jgi:hypothetical protein
MQEVHTSNLSPDIGNHERVSLLILSGPQENVISQVGHSHLLSNDDDNNTSPLILLFDTG